MCRRKWMLILVLGLLHSTRFVTGGPILTIEPTQRYTATQLTVTCDLAGVTTTGLTFFKDSSVLYTCLFIGLACGHKYGTSDYSDVDWSQTDKAMFTISNVTKTRDNGEWTCTGDSGGASLPVTLSITDAVCIPWTIVNGNFEATGTTYGTTADVSCNTGYKLYGNPTTTCQANGSWSGSIPSCKVSETKDGDQSLYFILVVIPLVGLFMAVFIVTRYNSTNTNPKESNPVLALHSLDLTVYQRKVGLSWTSPIAFDSTKVEYWFGSDKHITMSANTTSIATSTAEMTRLLPESVITFTITGEKDGTKYSTGILHQKTLKDTSSNTTMRNTTADGNRVYDTLQITSPGALPYQTLELNDSSSPGVYINLEL